MANFFIIITLLGQAKVASAIAEGETISLSEMSVGDADYTPSQGQTALQNELHRFPIMQIYRDSVNLNHVVAEGVIPAEIGGWEVREVGVWDSDGDLFAIGIYPVTYKPQLSEGSGKDLYIKFIMEVSSDAEVSILIDPAIVLASKKYVLDMFESHNADTEAHPEIYLAIAFNAQALIDHRVDGSTHDDIRQLLTSTTQGLADHDAGENSHGGKLHDDFPAGTRMYFYQDTAPAGWSVVAGISDCLIGVKGGGFNVDGGTIAGTWTQQTHRHTGPSHRHTTSNHALTSDQMPAHRHEQMINDGPYNRMWGRTNNPNHPTRYQIKQESIESGNFTPLYTNTDGGNDPHSHGDTGFSGSGYTNSTATVNTWRPRAAVGIIAEKDE